MGKARGGEVDVTIFAANLLSLPCMCAPTQFHTSLHTLTHPLPLPHPHTPTHPHTYTPLHTRTLQEGAVKLCRTNLELYDEVQRQWNNVWELPEREESDTSPYHSMIQACFNFGFEVSSSETHKDLVMLTFSCA